MMNDVKGRRDAVQHGEGSEFDVLPTNHDVIPPTPNSPWELEYEDDEPERPPAQLPLPSPPPLRLESRPRMENVAAVYSEVWHHDPPKNRYHAAYIFGRLWQATTWLQAFTYLHDSCRRSVVLEIRRLEPHLARACDIFLPGQGSRLSFDDWIAWHDTEQSLHFIEGLFVDASGHPREPLAADLEPIESQCLQLVGLSDDHGDQRLVNAIKLGIAVDKGIRPWRDGIYLSARFRDPWLSLNSPCSDPAWVASLRTRAAGLVELAGLQVSEYPTHGDIQHIDQRIQEQLSADPLADGDERRIFGLILNALRKSIRRQAVDTPEINLGQRFPIVDALARQHQIVTHDAMRAIYNQDAGYTGKYRSGSSAFSELVRMINTSLEPLRIEVVSVRNHGWRIVEM